MLTVGCVIIVIFVAHIYPHWLYKESINLKSQKYYFCYVESGLKPAEFPCHSLILIDLWFLVFYLH